MNPRKKTRRGGMPDFTYYWRHRNRQKARQAYALLDYLAPDDLADEETDELASLPFIIVARRELCAAS